MSIDLSSCNGCGVCITACHSENNVPVVGKDEVRRSRDMHWLRMDRYFSSIEDDNRAKWDDSKHVEGDFDYGKLEVPEELSFWKSLCKLAAVTYQLLFSYVILTIFCQNI